MDNVMIYQGEPYLDEYEIGFYNYSAEEVEDLARDLGIDTEHERHLLWISMYELLSAPCLPWKAFEPFDHDDDSSNNSCLVAGIDKVYFYNEITGEVSQKRPFRASLRETVATERAKVSFIPLTLSAREDDTGHTVIVGTTLAGEDTTQAVLQRLDVEMHEIFLKLRRSIHQKGEPKFFLQDGTMLGRSHNRRRVNEVFPTLSARKGSRSSSGDAPTQGAHEQTWQVLPSDLVFSL